MTRHWFRHLRRCRALFALALCAWLALASVAWALPVDDCCAGTAASASMHAAHANSPHDQGMSHPTATTDGCCAHASATVPPATSAPLPQIAEAMHDWQAGREAAPQPVYKPPLRPPVA